ncbi:MAG: Bax inhibitor-1/YccA family protein [Rickettsiales bacterium]|nr:Bax inhibitor-1/YccA family protein [Rickettsiales bacterium]
MDFSRLHAAQDVRAYDEGLRSFMLQFFNYMALGLALTGGVALVTASVPSFTATVLSFRFVLTIALFGIIMAMSFGFNKMNYSTLKTLYWTFCGMQGLVFSIYFLIYTGGSIARVFLITASVFGAMSIYGYTTKRNLTNFGSFLTMGLIGVILIMIVNMFLKSTGLMYLISFAILFIFIGMTAYDVQKLRNIYLNMGGTSEVAKKAGLMSALSLYLDFINIFVVLLHLFGDRK